MKGLLIIWIGFVSAFQAESQQVTKIVTIQGRRFIAYHDQWNFWIINSRKDTILKLEPSFMEFRFSDFDHDGYKDLLLELGGNIPDNYRLFLYVPKNRTFREVNGFDEVPQPLRITGTNYYYSYSRAGCGDETWISYLFYIKDYQVIKTGFINGVGCGKDDGIYIYKLQGDKKKLIRQYPPDTIGNYKDYKWGFLKQYWTRHWRLF